MVNTMNDTFSTLLATIRQLAAELLTSPEKTLPVTLDSFLKRDPGFGSLGRVVLPTRFALRRPVTLLREPLIKSSMNHCPSARSCSSFWQPTLSY